MNSFSFEDKDPRFTRLKPGLAQRLLSKGLFYIKGLWKIGFFSYDRRRGFRFSFSDLVMQMTLVFKRLAPVQIEAS